MVIVLTEGHNYGASALGQLSIPTLTEQNLYISTGARSLHTPQCLIENSCARVHLLERIIRCGVCFSPLKSLTAPSVPDSLSSGIRFCEQTPVFECLLPLTASAKVLLTSEFLATECNRPIPTIWKRTSGSGRRDRVRPPPNRDLTTYYSCTTGPRWLGYASEGRSRRLAGRLVAAAARRSSARRTGRTDSSPTPTFPSSCAATPSSSKAIDPPGCPPRSAPRGQLHFQPEGPLFGRFLVTEVEW